MTHHHVVLMTPHHPHRHRHHHHYHHHHLQYQTSCEHSAWLQAAGLLGTETTFEKLTRFSISCCVLHLIWLMSNDNEQQTTNFSEHEIT